MRLFSACSAVTGRSGSNRPHMCYMTHHRSLRPHFIMSFSISGMMPIFLGLRDIIDKLEFPPRARNWLSHDKIARSQLAISAVKPDSCTILSLIRNCCWYDGFTSDETLLLGLVYALLISIEAWHWWLHYKSRLAARLSLTARSAMALDID